METEIVCDRCGLHYAIFGVFAYCPDCGVYNSLQVLYKNLELIDKELALSETQEEEFKEFLVADALENAVSAFDGFGRELCRISTRKRIDPFRKGTVSFQNLRKARDTLKNYFQFDLAAPLRNEDWELLVKHFQKRHLIAHKMGVVDEDYIRTTGDKNAVIGSKVRIDLDDLTEFVLVIRKLGEYLITELGIPVSQDT